MAKLLHAAPLSDLSPADWETLEKGESVLLKHRPREKSPVDNRFVSVALLISAQRETIWNTINDKENASKFLQGIVSSKVLERNGNEILVEQRTRVGGPKGDYLYRLRHTLYPMEKALFVYAGGELKDTEGGWWIFDGKTPDTCVVVYALRVDPGLLAPQGIVKSGLKKSMPLTLKGIEKEVTLRESQR